MAVRLPDDIRPQWLSVIRRLQSVARTKNHGLAVLNIRIVVDASGTPIQWTEPGVTRLEPKGSKDELLALLTDGSSIP